MTSIRGGFLAAILVQSLGVAQVLSAQEAPTLERGQRVRVNAPGVYVSQSIGTLGAVTNDTVVLLQEPYRRVAIPRAAVQTLEVSRGRLSPIGPAVGIGTVVGAVAGALIASANYKDPCAGSQGLCFSNFGGGGPSVIGGMLVGSLAGALGGLLVGSALPNERWVGVPLDRPAGGRLSVAPLIGRRPGVALSLAF